MESRRKRSRSQLLKWGCYVLALFVCAALQTTPGLFQLGQARPLLVLPLCLAVAVFEGEFAGALFGTVGGLLWDYAAGRTVGMLALELLLLCFGVSVLVQLYLQVNFGNFAAVSTATALVVLSLDWRIRRDVGRCNGTGIAPAVRISLCHLRDTRACRWSSASAGFRSGRRKYFRPRGIFPCSSAARCHAGASAGA